MKTLKDAIPNCYKYTKEAVNDKKITKEKFLIAGIKQI